jgi:hypothetical protein
MRVTIIPADGFVSIDGEGFSGLDLSFMATDIHAVQWYGTDGELERKDNRGKIVANEIFTDISPYQAAIDAWNTKKEKAIAETEAEAIAAAEADIEVAETPDEIKADLGI